MASRGPLQLVWSTWGPQRGDSRPLPWLHVSGLEGRAQGERAGLMGQWRTAQHLRKNQWAGSGHQPPQQQMGICNMPNSTDETPGSQRDSMKAPRPLLGHSEPPSPPTDEAPAGHCPGAPGTGAPRQQGRQSRGPRDLRWPHLQLPRWTLAENPISKEIMNVSRPPNTWNWGCGGGSWWQ